MIAVRDLGKIARARLGDAEFLFREGRFDGAIYLAGYAIELTLKFRICKTLGWAGYPSSNSEFQKYQTFRTHDFDVLLRLSGREAKIKTVSLADWSAVAKWEPAVRYKPIGTATKSETQLMIAATKRLLKVL